MIDWETFSARVQAGTRCETYNPYYSSHSPIGGIVLYHMENSLIMVQEFERLTPISRLPYLYKYLIDGRWLSYDELMAGGTL